MDILESLGFEKHDAFQPEDSKYKFCYSKYYDNYQIDVLYDREIGIINRDTSVVEKYPEDIYVENEIMMLLSDLITSGFTEVSE